MSVCLFVSDCLSARFLKCYEWILMKFFGGVGRGPSNSGLDFGGSWNHSLDPGIL